VVRIVKDGKLQEQAFLDVSSLLTSSGNEQGLLGIAFHPKYSENGLFFIDYTDKKGQPTLARYSVSKTNPDQADPASGKVLLSVPHPFPNHNGGEIEFGPDGYLYWGLGDGGAAADPFDNGQNVQTMLGAILRLDVNADVYTIPPDNPFKNVQKARPELWAIGLRNPWRFSFDRKTGDLYIADVGQNLWEEIDFQPAGSKGGENYGWSVYEASMEFKTNKGVDKNTLVFPIAEYQHGDAGCSVTGGFVYRGKALPELDGTYLYGDYCSGWMWTLKRDGDKWKNTKFMETGFAITSFGLDADGELYVMDRKSGGLYKLVAG
jgi:glucose/arabinose dehydrogenase